MKKTVSLLLALIAIFSLCFALSACSNSDPLKGKTFVSKPYKGGSVYFIHQLEFKDDNKVTERYFSDTSGSGSFATEETSSKRESTYTFDKASGTLIIFERGYENLPHYYFFKDDKIAGEFPAENGNVPDFNNMEISEFKYSIVK